MTIKKTKLGHGVYILPSGKYSAELGLKELGEFDTKEEAATRYNTEIARVFAFPLYNSDGEIPIEPVYENKISIEEPIPKTSTIFEEYLKAKEAEKPVEEPTPDETETPKLVYLD